MNAINQLTITAQNPILISGFKQKPDTGIIGLERGGNQAESFYFAVGFLRRLLSFIEGMGWTKICGVCGRARHKSHFGSTGSPGKKPVCILCRSKKGKK